MEQQSAELGTELVLDNRKLILGFVLLVALCGACFVIGFMEGKRQAIQAKVEAMAPTPTAPASSDIASLPPAKTPEKVSEAAPAQGQPGRDQPDYYRNIQRSVVDAGKAAPKTDTPPAQGSKTSVAAAPSAKAINPPAPDIPAARATYSVQVGAFRQLKEAEAKFAGVKAKGFECTIEPPKPPDQLYRVKVGRFSVKADAVAMKSKLEKAGFSCIIKAN